MVVLKFCSGNWEVLTLLIGHEHNVVLSSRWVARKINEVIAYSETTYTVDNVLDMERKYCSLTEEGIYHLLLDAHMYHYSLIRFYLDDVVCTAPKTFIFGESEEDFQPDIGLNTTPESESMTDIELRQFLTMLESRQHSIMTAARMTQEQQERLLASCESSEEKNVWDIDLERAFMPDMPAPDNQEEYFDPICCTSEATRVDHFVDALFDFAKKEELDGVPCTLSNTFGKKTENMSLNTSLSSTMISEKIVKQDEAQQTTLNSEEILSSKAYLNLPYDYLIPDISDESNENSSDDLPEESSNSLSKNNSQASVECDYKERLALELEKFKSWPDAGFKQVDVKSAEIQTSQTEGALSMTTATSTDIEGKLNMVPVQTQTELKLLLELKKMSDTYCCPQSTRIRCGAKAKVIKKKKSPVKTDNEVSASFSASDSKEKTVKNFADVSREQATGVVKKSMKKESKEKKEAKEKKETKDKKETRDKKDGKEKKRKASIVLALSSAKSNKEKAIVRKEPCPVYQSYKKTTYHQYFPEEPVRPKAGEMLVLHSFDELPIEQMEELNIVRVDGKNFKKVKTQPKCVMRPLHRMPILNSIVAPEPCLVFTEESDFIPTEGNGLIKYFRIKNIGKKIVHWPNIVVRHVFNLDLLDLSVLPISIDVEKEVDIEVGVEIKDTSLEGVLIIQIVGDIILSTPTALIVPKLQNSIGSFEENQTAGITGPTKCFMIGDGSDTSSTSSNDCDPTFIPELPLSFESSTKEETVSLIGYCSSSSSLSTAREPEQDNLEEEEENVVSAPEVAFDCDAEYNSDKADGENAEYSDEDTSDEEFEFVGSDDQLSNYEYNELSED